MKRCIVIIPLYKEHPSKSEIASFRQGLSVLKRHDIAIVTHKDLNLAEYDIVSKELGKPFDVQYFHPKYFESVKGYNALCLSTEFYERFADYEYMLIYQTDAWVFKDELLEWCDKGYDYIGAPKYWSKDETRPTEFEGIGNGGFCLRRIEYCRAFLNISDSKIFLKPSVLFKQWKGRIKYGDKFQGFWKKTILTLGYIAKIFGYKNTLKYYKSCTNEDLLFSILASGMWSLKVNLPSEKEGLKFSFERFPQHLFQSIGNTLPFGCHAYHKYEYDTFWKKHIKE